MRILVLGGKGNMGRRYCAILSFLGHRPIVADIGDDPLREPVDGCIICTPTKHHFESILTVAALRVPIICEKPVTMIPSELPQLRDNLAFAGVPSFTMIHQYRNYQHEMNQTNPNQLSAYDFFRHGTDGLVWDCFQIIALARGPIELKEESPIWRCMINGNQLNLAEMDLAYVVEIAKWIECIQNGIPPEVGWDYIIRTHKKVATFERDWKERCEKKLFS